MDNLSHILKQHKLTQSDYQTILKILKREPNLIEIGIFSAMWSEHCSYKSSKIYLQDLPTQAPWVIVGPGENAGVIDIGDGYGVAFKIESHNHPSFIEPYAGASTGVGGIIRDIFTMGARPIANLNSIRFGNITPKEARKQRYLLKGVVSGIGDYGNCMGIPTIGGEMSFEECYEENILVNAFSLGLVKKDEIFYAQAKGEGNLVLYLGSKTGRDGLGGAVMSSDGFDHNPSLRSSVQRGDPFIQKLLLEACLELFQKQLIIGIQDMGAAGLTSSSFEMAGRSKSGMRLYLDKVPTREANMTPYELMLSESQERMLLCAKPSATQEIFDICQKWGVSCAIIGEVTQSGEMELFWHKERCACIPIAPLSQQSPLLQREVATKPSYLDKLPKLNQDDLLNHSQKEAFLTLLKSPEIADKAWVYEQYDSSILARTLVGPKEGGASVLYIKENNKALAMSVACPIRLCFLDPKEGAKQAIAKVGRDIALRGGIGLAITDCLNFGSPEDKEIMWQFQQTCLGIKEACQTLNMPVVSGNVSLYNQTKQNNIYPTPTIVGIGLISNPKNILKSHFQQEGNEIYLLSLQQQQPTLGGSLVAKWLGNSIKDSITPIHLDLELKLHTILQRAIEQDLLASGVDINQGGLALSLAKACIRGKLGCIIHKPLDFLHLFGQAPTQVLLEIHPTNAPKAKALIHSVSDAFSFELIGITTKEDFKLGEIELSLQTISNLFYQSFGEIMDQL